MTSTIIWTIVIITALGLLLALALYLVAQRFKVVEDPRIEEVEKVMPGANCGGCGYAGCHAFAEAAVKAPNLDNNFCPVGGNEVMKKVAAILGYEVKEKAPMVAVVRCNGTCENRPRIYEYDGARSCKTKVGVAPDTLCRFGCLGCGDCEAACKFGAIKVDPVLGISTVDETKCTACGACVKACPRGLIELRYKGPKGMRMYVACRNLTKGAEAREACDASCIGCGICFRTCQHDAIRFLNNVAYIDYTKCKLCRECEAMCPRGAIHGVNFPKPLDKAAVKARILERQKKAREAEAAAKAAEAAAEKPAQAPAAAKPVEAAAEKPAQAPAAAKPVEAAAAKPVEAAAEKPAQAPAAAKPAEAAAIKPAQAPAAAKPVEAAAEKPAQAPAATKPVEKKEE